jgi:hypothetical protein
MEYLRQYSELYPKDNLVITGGAAASLYLKRCNINTDIRDIDVNLITNVPGNILIERFQNILPDRYVAHPEYIFGNRLVHLRFIQKKFRNRHHGE